MTSPLLNQCESLNDLTNLLKNLNPTIGNLGGRFFSLQDKNSSYSMNQIVERFKHIVQKTKPTHSEILTICASIRQLEEADLFKALMNDDDKRISQIQKTFTKIRQFFGNFIFSLTHNFFNRDTILLSLSLGIPEENIHIDDNKLIITKNISDKSHFSWFLNLGLLRLAEQTAPTEEQKKQIRFLASNFLSKAAPVQIKCWRPLFGRINPDYENIFNEMFQVTPIEDYWYHRHSLTHETPYARQANDSLALGRSSLFALMDNVECQSLFPLKFSVIPSLSPTKETLALFQNILKKHLGKDPKAALANPLPLPFLYDATESLGELVKTNKEKSKEAAFTKKYDEIKDKIKQIIEQAIADLVDEAPSLKPYSVSLRKFVLENTVIVTRIQIDGLSGIKALPLTSSSQKKMEGCLITFINDSGIYLGAVSLRRQALDAFEKYGDIQYVPDLSGKRSETLYYPYKKDFINTKLFKRVLSLFSPLLESSLITQDLGIAHATLETHHKNLSKKPHFLVLGEATTRLIEGLFKEISSEEWDRIHKEPSLAPIFQSSLMMIREHLATAEMEAVAGNFNQFAQKIELIHAEIATLLELAHPFHEKDFAPLYKKALETIIPEALQAFCTCSLGKTSMNVYAGLLAAWQKENPDLETAYGPNTYFENVNLLSNPHTFEALKKHSDIKNIGFYVAQFNPNISIDTKVTSYKAEDIKGNLRYLLSNGKAAKHLTVAIDSTIDTLESDEINKLLEEFKDDIKEGRLNFVFFHSGQKFDMLGMDNYYGAPFYVINNGAKQWDFLRTLFTAPIHRTDHLSTQWFCLSMKYTPKSLDQYRKLIFSNTRYILDRIPARLLPFTGEKQPPVRVNIADPGMEACFIDVKFRDAQQEKNGWHLMKMFYEAMRRKDIKLYTRGSFGFYHAAFSVFSPDFPHTARLNPGINPDDNEALLDVFRSLAKS